MALIKYNGLIKRLITLAIKYCRLIISPDFYKEPAPCIFLHAKLLCEAKEMTTESAKCGWRMLSHSHSNANGNKVNTRTGWGNNKRVV